MKGVNSGVALHGATLQHSETAMLRSRRTLGRRICSLCNSSTRFAWIIAVLLVCLPVAIGYARGGLALQRIGRGELYVTNGAVMPQPDGSLAIETPSSRAVVRTVPGDSEYQVAEIHFRYLGATATQKPLAFGELRRQIGLKLRAADSCNVVYVMWRIEPVSRIVVSVKRNAGLHRHAQCGAHGYQTIAPRRHAAPPPIRVGDVHTLRAGLRGRTLTVRADGKAVWQGTLAKEPPAGPPGLRTDNTRVVLEYFAAGFVSPLRHRLRE